MLYEIPLKSMKVDFAIEAAPGETPGAHTLTWAKLINLVLLTPRPGGVNSETMRNTFAVIDEVEKCEDAHLGVLKLDRPLYNHLKTQLKAHTWGVPKREFIAFEDDVFNAKQVEANAPPAKAVAKAK